MSTEMLELANDGGGVLAAGRGDGSGRTIYLTDAAGVVRSRRCDAEDFEVVMSAVVRGGVAAAAGFFEGSEALTLSGMERQLDALRGERCYDENGALDSSKVQAFASEKGIPYPEAVERLRGLDSTDQEREDEIVADLAEELVAREELHGREMDFGDALIEVMRARVRREPEPDDAEPPTRRSSTADGEDVRIADLADAYAAEHGVDYATALLEVQYREGR